MKIIDEREMQKRTKKQANKDRKNKEETEAIKKGWELDNFAVHLS